MSIIGDQRTLKDAVAATVAAPGIVRVRLEGESAGDLASRLAAMPGVTVVTGPDAYPGARLYLTVAVADDARTEDGDE